MRDGRNGLLICERQGNHMEKSAVQLLKEIIEIPSVNSRDREKAVAEYLADYFKGYGIEAQVQDIDELHGNVVAFVPGKNKEKTVLWNGHLDTVPYGSLEEWKTDPSKAVEKDGRIYGRGSSDMKSGVAAMAYALCHLGEEPACNIRFVGSCDEEKGGLGAEKALEAGYTKDVQWILVGEPTDMKLGIAQKGCLWLEMQIKGKTSHGAYPKEGANAVSLAARLAEKIQAYVGTFSHEILGSSTGQITMIEGGVANNMTPDYCRTVMDIRMVPGLTAPMVIEYAGKLMEEEKSGDTRLSGQFTALNDRRAIEIPGSHPMTAGIRGLLKEAGYTGEDLGINFFSDASVLDRAGEKDILLFGPGDPAMAHQPNEFVEIGKYQDAIRILQEFAKNFLQE